MVLLTALFRELSMAGTNMPPQSLSVVCADPAGGVQMRSAPGFIISPITLLPERKRQNFTKKLLKKLHKCIKLY